MKKMFFIILMFSLMSFTFNSNLPISELQVDTILIGSGHANKARELGYTKTNYRSHGQAVYYRSQAKFALKYISPDVDGHNGGYWKVASSVTNLGSKSKRTGTYNANLTNRIGD